MTCQSVACCKYKASILIDTATTQILQLFGRAGDVCSKVQLTTMFRQFDRDGNGFITLMEASNILQRDPFKFPPSKVLTLLKQFDKDGNGKLDIEEFAGFYAEAKAMSVI